MWEANVRTTLSKIIAHLRQVKPNWERMIYTVSDLAIEVRNENLPSLVETGGPTPSMKNQKACEVCAELESLEAALSERNIPKALEHAEGALRVLG
jgi:hypothetical protein